MTTIQLNAKRRKKEIKRKAKRRKLFLASVLAKVGRKARALREKAMNVILNSPVLLDKFMKHQEKLNAETKGVPEKQDIVNSNI